MGQGSEPTIWSTHGGLRWSKEGEYKREKPYYIGVCSVRFGRFYMCMANRNRIFRFVKFSTETDWNGWKLSVSMVFRFQSVSIFQREGHWDFQNPNFNHIKKEKKKLSNRAVEQSWWTKLIQSDRERNEKREKEKRRIIPWEKKEDDRVVGRLVLGGHCVEVGMRRSAAERRFGVTVE